MAPASLPPAYRVEPLNPQHDRTGFCCGTLALDVYIQRQARQDVERKLAAVFVLTPDGTTVAGVYALSAHSILAGDLPESLTKRLPRSPLPVTVLGRMAVSQTVQRQGLGAVLLAHALERAWIGSQQIASWAVVVDAKIGAHEFYRKHDFIALPSQPDHLFLPMATIEKLFKPL